MGEWLAAILPPHHRSSGGSSSGRGCCNAGDRYIPTSTAFEEVFFAGSGVENDRAPRWRPSRANRIIGRFRARKQRCFASWPSSMRWEAPLRARCPHAALRELFYAAGRSSASWIFELLIARAATPMLLGWQWRRRQRANRHWFTCRLQCQHGRCCSRP